MDGGNVTGDTLELLKGALARPDDALAKTISTGTGIVAYDLQAPAKNLYPFYTPLRNRVPRVGGGTGTATNWRAVLALLGSGFDAMGWVPEGQRSGQMAYTTANRSASYVTLGEEDAATYEAIAAGRGFEDIQARMTFRLLQKIMMKEEMAILAGNAGGAGGGLSLGTPGTITTSASGSGATLPTLTYSVICVALTLEGFQNTAPGGFGATGVNTVASGNTALISSAISVPTSKTITGADGKTYALNGGSSNKSAAVTQAVTLGQTLFASIPAIQGAVAYAWFTGAAGSETLQAITTINSVAITAPLIAGMQPATAITADTSGNPNSAYNGLLTSALASGSGAYLNSLATGTAGTGTPLTTSGRGSVIEIDGMLQQMWQQYGLSVTALYVNAQEQRNITSKVLSNASGPLLRFDQDASGEGGYDLTASGQVAYYMNPFVPTPRGGRRIPVIVHPRVPAGTILGYAEDLPIQYQSNEVPNVAEVKTRQDYYQIDWPVVTRQRQVGVYCESVLAVYAPFAMGVITNIGNG